MNITRALYVAACGAALCALAETVSFTEETEPFVNPAQGWTAYGNWDRVTNHVNVGCGYFRFQWQQFNPAEDDGIDATLAYAGLVFSATKQTAPSQPNDSAAPFPAVDFGLDCTYLSGDDPDTKRNEAFNPLFSRYPFLSELMIYCFDTEGAGNWNNIVHPRAKASLRHKGHDVTLSAGPVFAEERNGAGGGRERGWLYTAQYGFPLFGGFEGGRGKTTGLLLLEILDPGDYYLSDHTAYFFRWKISMAF